MRFWTNALANSLAFFVGLIPKPLRWQMASLLGWFWFDLLKFRRFTILKNLSIAFPEKSHAERLSIGRKSTQYLCYNLFEFLLIPKMNKSWLGKELILEGVEHFEAARKQGRGDLLLSMHIGNGDIGMATLALADLPVHLISKKFKSPWLNDFWFGVRERLGAHFMEPHGKSLAFDILKICKKNEAVVFVIDQFMGRPFGIETTFFGKKTGTAYGLALFANKTQAPILPIYTYRDEMLRTHVVFEAPVVLPDVTGLEKDLQNRKMIQKCNDVVESLVRQHPLQWMWVHRRWKKWE
jgi:Kdo2-lipid IVA lauroyltransferase/acyltransferase